MSYDHDTKSPFNIPKSFNIQVMRGLKGLHLEGNVRVRDVDYTTISTSAFYLVGCGW
jgi:CxxC motif-containing protein